MRVLIRSASVFFAPLLGWVAAHPVRTAGMVAALLAAWVTLASLGVVSPAGVTTEGLTTARVAGFAVAHPAYPVATLLGLWTFLFAR
jgi:hypothetical protein